MAETSKADNRRAKTRARVAKYRQRKRDAGLVPFNALVPSDVLAEFIILAKACRENPDYYPAAVRDRTNGRMISLNNVQPKRGKDEQSN